jgi:hypothetical protein
MLRDELGDPVACDGDTVAVRTRGAAVVVR